MGLKYRAVIVVGALIVLSLTSCDPQPPPPLNVLVINTDDQRADTLQFLPGIRHWLADGGTTFRKGYVSTPSCCPSRATLMSGRYVHNNGQYHQLTLGLDQSLTTQRYLHDAGYLTGHAGKFLHWLPLADTAPYWDRWTYFQGGYNDVEMNFDGTVSQSEGYSTNITFDKAIDYVDDFESRDDTKPWYVHVAPIAPHSPSAAEAKYRTATVPAFEPDPSYLEADRSDKPPFVQAQSTTVAATERIRTNMIRTLYSLDDGVDRLMRHLEEKGELANTLVVFTSDNGSQWGEHHQLSKFVPYPTAVNVPFVMRWPGHIAAGAVDDRPVTHVDVAPTILKAAGVTDVLTPMDGEDILSGSTRQTALTEYWKDPNNNQLIPTWASIRTTDYQYTEYYDAADAVTFREYYDMVQDPFQLTNLLADGNPANDPPLDPLAAALADAKHCVGTACP